MIFLVIIFFLFLSVFFLFVSSNSMGIIFLTIFVMGGSRSAERLAWRAYSSGNPHKAVMFQFKTLAFWMFTDIVIQIILFLGVFVTLYCMDLIHKMDSCMIWIKQNGITILLLTLGVYCVAVAGIRLYFRTITKNDAEDESSSTTIDEPFCVYSYSQPLRNSNNKRSIQVGIHLYLIFIFYPSVFIIPELRSFALILGMIGLMIIAFLLYKIVRESYTVDLLIKLDSDGIHDCNPTRNIGFIPWSKINSFEYVKNRDCIMLHLNADENDSPEAPQTAMLQLGKAFITPEIIEKKMLQFHQIATQSSS